MLSAKRVRSEDFEEVLLGKESDTLNQLPQIGLLEQASGGSLILEDIENIPLNMQMKLSRLLQRNKFSRVGGI